MRDPRNARYLVPFVDTELEDEAVYTVAPAIYSAVGDEELNENTTKLEADQVFLQCLVAARRMMCDLEYLRLFNPDASEADLDADLNMIRRKKAQSRPDLRTSATT